MTTIPKSEYFREIDELLFLCDSTLKMTKNDIYKVLIYNTMKDTHLQECKAEMLKYLLGNRHLEEGTTPPEISQRMLGYKLFNDDFFMLHMMAWEYGKKQVDFKVYAIMKALEGNEKQLKIIKKIWERIDKQFESRPLGKSTYNYNSQQYREFLETISERKLRIEREIDRFKKIIDTLEES